ncbi:MAG: hypothetical protein KY410_03995, partial [Proteobacteria bacterium]|nr:hypothetical protein [Pseudomonadota bacterium]
MLGSFLEISVYSPDVLESLGFYERLGFSQIPTNDAWTHPYGVVTDGRCFIGIHAYEFPGPSLTFVAPELRKRVEPLEAAGVEFEFLKLADDQFHELGFLAPDDQMVTLLEARTFSPPASGLPESLLGFFVEYRIPVEDRDAAVAQWLRLGMMEGEPVDTFHDTATVCYSGLNVGLGESRRLKKPELVFHVTDLPARLSRLEQLGITAQIPGNP